MAGLMEGKAGLVTGGGLGIGRASAIAFAAAGAKVVVSDISPDTGVETVRLIKEAGGEAFFHQCDISQEDQVIELINVTVAAYGKLDWAHNNAGIACQTVPIVDSKTEDWEKTINVNLDGTYFSLKHEIAAMIKSGGGAIVNTSSMSGLGGTQTMAAYSASKWGINGLTRTAALENGKNNIRVNSVCPGMTLTPGVEAWAKAAPEHAESVKSLIPLGRIAVPEEIAEAAVWLCSDKASYITGVNLPIDGGREA